VPLLLLLLQACPKGDFMTHDERIEAMAKALQRMSYARCDWSWSDAEFDDLSDRYQAEYLADARAAWAAADVEGMVREAVVRGVARGATQGVQTGVKIDAIVQRVTQGAE
jgi:hypothetical protein